MMQRCRKCNLLLAEGAQSCIACGTAVENPGGAGVLVGGAYAVEREIGHGSMGVVYRASDVLLDRPVALKVINADLARNTAFVTKFCGEARALASIRNNHVVSVFAMGMHDGSYFYAMEFVEGHDLEFIVHEHLAYGSFLPTVRALTILRAVAEGLEAVHRVGLVHRDVKPANIMIADGTGRPVLIDFGLARPVAAVALNATQVVGSPPYMAPEQIVPMGDDDGITALTDVYALGCTAFELFTGRTPFVVRADQPMFETLQAHLQTSPPRLSSLRPDLEVLDPVIDRALAKSPADRWESALAFAEALDRASVQLRALGSATPAPSPAPVILPAGDAFRVLVVDDDPDFCSIATRAVQAATRGAKVEVTAANTGLKALTAALRSPPQLVLLDYDMPGMTGIETLSELRALPGAAQAPVLVVSANVGAVERWRFSVLGVKDFLRKPVDLRDFIDVIARLARKARAAAAPTESLVEDRLPPPRLPTQLPVELFLALSAVAWADGRLDAEEREGILRAAQAAELDESAMQQVRSGLETRVDLADLRLAELPREVRLNAFGIARWIAILDGNLTSHEEATLRVLAVALRLHPRDCDALERYVRERTATPDDRRPEVFDFAALRGFIAAHVAATS